MPLFPNTPYPPFYFNTDFNNLYRNVKHQTAVPVTSESISKHKTFMDTQGRTMLTLTARNIVDEMRDREVIVTYDYPLLAGLRKPLVICAGVSALFVAAWAVGTLDVGIKGERFVGKKAS